MLSYFSSFCFYDLINVVTKITNKLSARTIIIAPTHIDAISQIACENDDKKLIKVLT